jgi:hypothetical protein
MTATHTSRLLTIDPQRCSPPGARRRSAEFDGVEHQVKFFVWAPPAPKLFSSSSGEWVAPSSIRASRAKFVPGSALKARGVQPMGQRAAAHG